MVDHLQRQVTVEGDLAGQTISTCGGGSDQNRAALVSQSGGECLGRAARAAIREYAQRTSPSGVSTDGRSMDPRLCLAFVDHRHRGVFGDEQSGDFQHRLESPSLVGSKVDDLWCIERMVGECGLDGLGEVVGAACASLPSHGPSARDGAVAPAPDALWPAA